MRGLGPFLKHYTVRVAIERHTTECNDVAVRRADVVVDNGHSTEDVFEAKDSDFKAVH